MSPPIAESIRQSGGIIAHDDGWQFPAISEQHAYARVRDTIILPEGVTYVAYPWATLIDKLQSRAADADRHLRRFGEFCDRLPSDTIKLTVCQQIYLRQYLHLFAAAGIHHIFWSHATPSDVAEAASGAARPAIHPFPLYPVQIPTALPAAAPEADGARRQWLFSFIGARASEHYPRPTRNLILEALADDPRGLVVGRDRWFYEQAVYDRQIHGRNTGADRTDPVEQEEAAQFRAALEHSTFALCPAGTGPNSIRLWEAIGAGAIPVILADDWAPPGKRDLWEAACLFRPETRAAICALPDELAALANDPAQLAARRRALRQLWLFYGPEGFVCDIHRLLQDPHKLMPPAQGAALSQQDARRMLTRLSGMLLVDPALGDRLAEDRHPLAHEALGALAALRPDEAVRGHFEAVIARCGMAVAAVDGAPAILRSQPPKVHSMGRHAHLTPLACDAFRRELGARIALTERPEDADVLLAGVPSDLHEAAERIAALREKKPGLKLMVISPEPPGGAQEVSALPAAEGRLDNGIAFRLLTPGNSAIFDFARIPYATLLEDERAAIYATRFAAMARPGPADLLARWNAASVSAAFFFERHDAADRVPAPAARDCREMTAYRIAVAQAVRDRLPGTLCISPGAKGPWDTLATLSGRTRIYAALESVLQQHHVTQNLFDSFAAGAIPIYCAGPQHRALEFVPAHAMINIHGLAPREAADRIVDFRLDAAFAVAWRDTAQALARMFADIGALQVERRRVARALAVAISEYLSGSTMGAIGWAR